MENIAKPSPITIRPDTSSSGLGSGALSPLTLGLVSCGGVGVLLWTIHTDAAYVLFLALAGGCFVLARRFAVEPRWRRRWAKYSMITSVIILILFVLFIGTIGTALPSGLYERESALAHALWRCLIVVALLAKRRSGPYEARKP